MNSRQLPLAAFIFLLGMVCAAPDLSAIDRPQPQSGVFATPLTNAAIDNGSLAEWMDGAEHPLANPNVLRQLVWTQTDATQGGQMRFGVSSQPGVRHLRIGFTSPIAVGSILVRAGGQLSILRTGAPYPGNLGDDSQWIPAQRILNRQLSVSPVDQDSFAVWVLPPGARTRALRFTYTSAPTDSIYAGTLGGVYLLSSRMTNLAPQAIVQTSANNNAANLVTNEKYDNWLTWDNGPEYLHPVTPANPEWLMLTWSRAVALNGLAALWAGFNAADVQVFAGPENVNPQGAPEADWHPIGQSYTLHSQYPRPLGVDWLDFGKTVQTRAVRVRMTAVTDESHHQHLVGKTRNGNRVWLGELMALSSLQSADLSAALLPAPATSGPEPPIPVHFNLQSAGYVTLVIDDARGNRVRNLISNTWFAAGANTVFWDGTDDLGRDLDAPNHGVYFIPTNFVSAGAYQVRGISHQAIDLHYEFSVYNAGHPAWETADTKGGWLTNHTPPSSALFVPAEKAPGGKPLVYLGSYISEGGSGLAWVDLNGVKQGGRGWIGGNWTAAPYLARDTGTHADPNTYAYVGAVWYDAGGKDNKQTLGVVRLTALTTRGDKPVLTFHYDPQGKVDNDSAGRPQWMSQIGGFAIHDNLAVVSLARQDELLFADASSGRSLGLALVQNPQGLAFDSQGRLLVLSGNRLLRVLLPGDKTQLHPEQLAHSEPLIAEGLEAPAGVTLDSAGNIYISDRGNSNQVKVFSPTGKFLHAIGHPGPSKAGPYDPQHMNNPRGISIDSNNHLWVAEEDFQPKRVSVWTVDGKLIKGFYGPSEYGGGGSLDPQDKSLFYYHGMEFKLDWKAGTDTLTSVLYRPDPDALSVPAQAQPSTVLYSNGHRYFTNVFMGEETQGVSIAVVYLDSGGVIRPGAAFGKANDWPVLQQSAFRSLWPQGADPASRTPDNSVVFTWSDLNGNGKVDPEEVTFLKSTTGSLTVTPDLTMIDADVEGNVMSYAPVKFTSAGIPVFDIHKGLVISDGAQMPPSDGGGQVLYSPRATVETTAPLPFARAGLGGVDGQNHRWSYPSLWPGLHPSHSAPVADRRGEIIGTTRLLGGFVSPAGSEANPLWAINGNLGDMYLFTADGLFVTQLFQDNRTGKPWNMPLAQRNMLLNDVSMSDENFFPSLTQTSDGNVYLDDGVNTSIVRIDGLGTIRRIAAFPLQVTPDELNNAAAYLKLGEAARQESMGARTLAVSIRSGPPPALKDLIASLKTANWATIDHRVNQIGWSSNPDETQAAITIAGGRLFAAFRSSEPNLLLNSGAVANAPFKTGGALDLMIGTNPQANPKRQTPVPGDLRLLVYQVSGKPKAMLYRAVVPGVKNPVLFSSPARTIALDQVIDVTNQVELFATGGTDAGNFTFSISLNVLGLNPVAGETIKADIGILRGDGAVTRQRVYWSNKATGITSDVPSEAEFTPNLWGEWTFK